MRITLGDYPSFLTTLEIDGMAKLLPVDSDWKTSRDQLHLPGWNQLPTDIDTELINPKPKGRRDRSDIVQGTVESRLIVIV